MYGCKNGGNLIVNRIFVCKGKMNNFDFISVKLNIQSGAFQIHNLVIKTYLREAIMSLKRNCGALCSY